MASSSAQKVRHRMLGSTPCISTMSRSRARRAAVRDPHRRPHQLPGHAVDLADHRPVHLVVVVGLVVDLDDRLGLPDGVQVLERVAGRVTGVVPALERRDDDGVVEFGQVGSLRTARHPTGSPRQRKPCMGRMTGIDRAEVATRIDTDDSGDRRLPICRAATRPSTNPTARRRHRDASRRAPRCRDEIRSAAIWLTVVTTSPARFAAVAQGIAIATRVGVDRSDKMGVQTSIG